MKGCLLIILPTSLVADVLNKWLSVSDRVRLDSAHCSLSGRDDFLQLLRSPELAIRSWVFDKKIYGIAKETTDNVVRWANIREVFVDRVSVGKDSDLAVYNSFLKRCGQDVLTVIARNTSIDDLTPSLSQCNNLEVLDIMNCDISPSLRSVFEHCQNLKYLRIDLFHGTENSLCSTFDNINPGLTALALTVELELTLTLETVQKLVNRFSSLVHLSLCGCDLTVPMIRELGNLQHLRSLDIASCKKTTDGMLVLLADACGDKLTELLLCENYSLSLAAVQEVLPHFTKLTSFSMHYDEEDEHIFNFSLLSRFTNLTVVYDGDYGSDFVSDLAHHCAKQLQHLHFQLFDDEFLAEDMDVLVSACTKLRSLHLASEFDPYHDSEDVARWQGMRPNLVVSDVFKDQLSVFRDLDKYDV